MMVGESARSKNLLRQIDRVAQGRWPVLVMGETGTGKEVAARNIFKRCPVGEFVTIDCSSLVGPLLESELFGHARGAFTGAVGQKVGLLEMANGGTAFFDEVGELPLDLQAKLLRVLQEKEFRPVGSLSIKRSDFRIIAATNRDLAKEVERGTFRRDLYYRLNVVTLRLAPLRERVEDVVALAQHFLERHGKGHVMSAEAIDFFSSYDWPGNVRELENCIQQMVARNSGPVLPLLDMPSAMQHFLHESKRELKTMVAGVGSNVGFHAPVHEPGPQPSFAASLPTEILRRPPVSDYEILPLMEIERRAILGALKHTNGDRATAANLLGIGRTTLYRQLKEYEALAV